MRRLEIPFPPMIDPGHIGARCIHSRFNIGYCRRATALQRVQLGGRETVLEKNEALVTKVSLLISGHLKVVVLFHQSA